MFLQDSGRLGLNRCRADSCFLTTNGFGSQAECSRRTQGSILAGTMPCRPVKCETSPSSKAFTCPRIRGDGSRARRNMRIGGLEWPRIVAAPPTRACTPHVWCNCMRLRGERSIRNRTPFGSVRGFNL